MIPERDAADRLAQAVGEHLSPRWLSAECLRDVMAKVVAHRVFFRSVFDSLDADPHRLPDRDVVLRQDAVAQMDSVEWWSEHAGHLKREYEDALRILEGVKAGTLSQLVDRQAALEDADDARISQERRDEKANEQAPRIAG